MVRTGNKYKARLLDEENTWGKPTDEQEKIVAMMAEINSLNDRIPSTTPGAEPPRDAKDSGSARSHSTHLETSSSNRP